MLDAIQGAVATVAPSKSWSATIPMCVGLKGNPGLVALHTARQLSGVTRFQATGQACRRQAVDPQRGQVPANLVEHADQRLAVVLLQCAAPAILLRQPWWARGHSP
jgi:hypothetical protein